LKPHKRTTVRDFFKTCKARFFINRKENNVIQGSNRLPKPGGQRKQRIKAKKDYRAETKKKRYRGLKGRMSRRRAIGDLGTKKPRTEN
jgi:hypothetical protein